MPKEYDDLESELGRHFERNHLHGRRDAHTGKRMHSASSEFKHGSTLHYSESDNEMDPFAAIEQFAAMSKNAPKTENVDKYEQAIGHIAQFFW